jgi:hypothetical protein
VLVIVLFTMTKWLLWLRAVDIPGIFCIPLIPDSWQNQLLDNEPFCNGNNTYYLTY